MPGPFHTLTYPATRTALRRGLAFPAKAPGDVRRYTLDMAAFTQDAGSAIASVFVRADTSLLVAEVEHTAKIVTFTVTGGDALMPLPTVAFAIRLENGDVETLTAYQPVDALLPAVPLDAVGPQPLPAEGSRLVDDFGNSLTALAIVTSFAAPLTGDGIRKLFIVQHDLGTTDVSITVQDPLDGNAEIPGLDKRAPTPDTAEVEFGAPPAIGVPFRIIVSKR